MQNWQPTILQKGKLMINCLVWLPISQFGTILGPWTSMEEMSGVVGNPNVLPQYIECIGCITTVLAYWSQQGKSRVWLKILEDEADLVPVAIKESSYHLSFMIDKLLSWSQNSQNQWRFSSSLGKSCVLWHVFGAANKCRLCSESPVKCYLLNVP